MAQIESSASASDMASLRQELVVLDSNCMVLLRKLESKMLPTIHVDTAVDTGIMCICVVVSSYVFVGEVENFAPIVHLNILCFVSGNGNSSSEEIDSDEDAKQKVESLEILIEIWGMVCDIKNISKWA